MGGEAAPAGPTEEKTDVTLITYIEESTIPQLTTEFSELGEIDANDIVLASRELLKTMDVSQAQEYQQTKAAAGRAAEAALDELSELIYTLEQSKTLRKDVRSLIIRHKRTAGIRQMTYGFLGYPVSQAADITFVNAHLVPVGEDQVPHIELTREIARRMNKQYGGRRRILVEPQALIGGATIKGLDGNAKMSKSLGNAVYLSDSDQDIWSKVKKAVTDPQRVRKDDPGRPEICTIFAYHQQFNATTEPNIAAADLNVPAVEETAQMCRTAGIGCVECKQNLAAKLKAMLDPMRERRSKWEKDIPGLMDILKAGTGRGNEEGNATADRVKTAMHVDYWK
ncbi:tryptophan--tRNA ligase [bacterium]|nr:tryptophan--tRNA ligase [bacterium]